MRPKDLSSDISKLSSSLVQLAQKGQSISNLFERGQADCPLSAAFEQIAELPREVMLRISLLPMSRSALDSVLAWLVPTFVLNLGQTESRAALLRLNCDQLHDSSDHLSTFGIEAQSYFAVEILVPENTVSLIEDAQLYQHFCSHGQMLAAAWEPLQEPSRDDLQLLRDLVDVFDVVWPLVVSLDESGTNARDPVREILGRKRASMPLSSIARAQRCGNLSVLCRKDDPLRLLLGMIERSRCLQAALESLSARQTREECFLALRRQEVENQLKLITDSARPHQMPPAVLVAQVTDSLSTLESEIVSANERTIQPLGESCLFMRGLVEPLGISDLNVEYPPNIIRLSLTAGHLATINRQLRTRLTDNLRDDVRRIGERLLSLTKSIELKLQDARATAELRTHPLDERRIWLDVENLIAVGKESHIEIKRRGLFDVLTAGRQKVFILIMLASLAGRVGISNNSLATVGLDGLTNTLQYGFSTLLISVFIGSMLSALTTWKHEKKTQLDNEMTRIRNSLYDDGCRVIEQVHKTKLASLRTYLRDTGKRLAEQIDLATKVAVQVQMRELQSQQTRRDEAIRSLDARDKDVADCRRHILKLQQEGQDLVTACRSTAAELAQSCEIQSLDHPVGVEWKSRDGFIPTDADAHAATAGETTSADVDLFAMRTVGGSKGAANAIPSKAGNSQERT